MGLSEKYKRKVSATPNLLRIQKRRCDTMAQDVLCEVNNCKYWDEGNKCGADAIYVVSHKGKQASNSEETDCKTFVPEV
jgi:hypothetical protein